MNSIARRAILIAGLLLAFAGLIHSAGAYAKKAGDTERVLRLKEEGYSDLHLPTGDIVKEVLRGHATLNKVGEKARQRLRTTEYVDGWVTSTGPTTFDVDLTVKIVAKKAKKGKIGSLAGTCTGSAVRDLAAGVSDGVWNCTAIGGTGRFEGATGEVTVYVHIEPVSVDPTTDILHANVFVRAKGRISY